MMGFAFWSGLRISDLIALAWEDTDLKSGTVKFCRARVNGSYKQTKTKRSTHEVELIDPVTQELLVQRPFTKRQNARRLKIMSRENKKTPSEDAFGLAQFVLEGLGVAEKLGQKWSHACREI